MIKIIAMLAAIGATDVSRKEINCLSTAVYHEARGESIAGQSAVAHVILNRVSSKRYPDSICGVVYQHKQFSYIEHAKPNRESKEWSKAIAVSILAYKGHTEDLTKGATHYYAHDLVSPQWANMKQTTLVLGGHTFKIAQK